MPPRKSSNIINSKAFNPIFTNNKFNIPQQLEDLLLDSFTMFCEDNSTEDLLLSDLLNFLGNYLKISKKLLGFVDLNRFILDGTDNVVDFEKYLYQGSLLLTLNKNLKIVDLYWNLLIDNLNGLEQVTKNDNESKNEIAYQQRIYLNDLDKLVKALNSNTPTSILMDMLTVANTDEDKPKLYLDYFDFALILGRLGELEEYT